MGSFYCCENWTPHRANSFFEGMARVWTGDFEIAYLDKNDLVFRDVTLPTMAGDHF